MYSYKHPSMHSYYELRFFHLNEKVSRRESNPEHLTYIANALSIELSELTMGRYNSPRLPFATTFGLLSETLNRINHR